MSFSCLLSFCHPMSPEKYCLYGATYVETRARPYWKKSHKAWYVKIDGVHHRLGKDRETAWKRYHALVAGRRDFGPDPEAITGRAGLFPSRDQSVDVDLADGKTIRCRNRRLRTILIRIADNLIQCNHHFGGLNAIWKSQGKDPRWSRVKVACRFTRILYQIVAGQQVFRHPSQRGRAYILDKLVAFHRHHATPLDKTLIDLNATIRQIPEAEYHNEAAPLQTRYERTQNRRRRQPPPIGDILLVVLAKLGVATVPSTSEHRYPS